MSGPDSVFDYMSELPWVTTERWDDVIREASEAGASVADALTNELPRARQEDLDYRRRLRTAFDDAGLNLLSVTVSSRSRDWTYAEGVRRDLDRWQAMFDAVGWLRKAIDPATAREVVTDGDIGVVAVPGFAAPDRPDTPRDIFFDHVEYAVERVGADRVGVGSDFANVDAGIPDAAARELVDIALNGEYMWGEHHRATELGIGWRHLRTFTDWPVIANGVLRRFPAADAGGILGENFLAFWERVDDGRE